MEDSFGTTETGKPVSRKEFNIMSGIIIGVAIVCGVAFITLVISYYDQSAASYQELKSKVVDQSIKIDSLVQQISQDKKDREDQKDVDLQNQISELKKNNPYLK